MRETIDEFDVADGTAEAFIEFDTGGPVGSEHLVGVRSKENSDDIRAQWDPDEPGWIVNRWFFFDEWDEHYARNFAEKIASDGEYRLRSLAGVADWKRVHDHYMDADERIFDEFQSRGLIGYTTGDKDAKRRSRDATERMRDICRTAFEGIKRRVRDPDNIDDNAPEPYGVEGYIDHQVLFSERIATELKKRNP